ncbi:RNA polymerase sigma-70 factor (ECF subfamily) [Kribbella sp. VKM Ac-2568]|nr:RNA polymerase sigma-70 factor (ECF subfamily) [Kribbella sp. VKM Ac-2568]
MPDATRSLILDEFVEHRRMLAGLAYRLLGSWHDAEDVLQEAYLRWARVDRAQVLEPRRYLTTVVTRLAIDSLRARQARRENYVGDWLPEPLPLDSLDSGDTSDLSLAMLHLMEQLTPPQRAVYVLRTAFVLPYDEVAAILDRSADDCRQLHRRAAAALEKGRPKFTPSRAEQERLLRDFVAAAREGDLARLESMLRAEVTAWTDGAGQPKTARKPVLGQEKVARFFTRIYTRGDQLAAVPIHSVGEVALLLRVRETSHLLTLQSDGSLVTAVRVVANPEKLSAFEGHDGGSAVVFEDY